MFPEKITKLFRKHVTVILEHSLYDIAALVLACVLVSKTFGRGCSSLTIAMIMHYILPKHTYGKK